MNRPGTERTAKLSRTLLYVVLVLMLGIDLPSMPFLLSQVLAPPDTVAVQHNGHHDAPAESAPDNPHAHCLMCLLPAGSLPEAETAIPTHDPLVWNLVPYRSQRASQSVTSTLGPRGPPA